MKLHILRAPALVLAVMALGAIAHAQQAPITASVRYRLKPNREADFRAAVKEYNALRKTVGTPYAFAWWSAQAGSREFVSLRYYAKWADVGAPMSAGMREHAGEAEAILARMRDCTESMERDFTEMLPDLSIPRSGEIPPFIYTIRTVVKPDMTDEYMNVVKSQVLPAMKKAGVSMYVVARTRFGGPRSEFVSSRGLKGWADLDQPTPIATALGQEGSQKLLTRIAAMTVSSEYSIYRYEPDLSYYPAK